MSAPSHSQNDRFDYLDFTKGVLVVLMVVYHSLNYTNQYHLAFRYLSFLPLSFILITGLLLRIVYAERYPAASGEIRRRLLTRGIKLLILFTVLNVVAQFVRSPVYGRSVGVTSFFVQWIEVYLVGGSRLAAFEVLLPIAFLLLAAPWLIAASLRHSAIIPTAAILSVAAAVALEWSGNPQPNFSFMAAGILGIWLGRLFGTGTRLGQWMWPALVAYAAYFPLGMSKGHVFAVQLLGALVVLLLIVSSAIRHVWPPWFSRRLHLLGQYSLLCYVVQIAALQLMSRFFGRPDPLSLPALCLFVGAMVVTYAAAAAAKVLRRRSAMADRVYRLVFA